MPYVLENPPSPLSIPKIKVIDKSKHVKNNPKFILFSVLENRVECILNIYRNPIKKTILSVSLGLRTVMKGNRTVVQPRVFSSRVYTICPVSKSLLIMYYNVRGHY